MISSRSAYLALFCSSLAAAQAVAQPATDIYLGALTVRDGRVRIGSLMNITTRPGYDNQPHFAPDGRNLLYTSIRAGDGQADTYRYDIVSASTQRLTFTTESEYSPTVMPNAATFSVVRVEADSTQRLWRFDIDGSNPVVLLPDVRPVGYHAWLDSLTVALFILGSPPTLQLADIRTGTTEIVEAGIGRSLHKIPSREALSYVHKVADDEWWIKALDWRTRRKAKLVQTLAGSEDHAWTPDRVILAGRGSKLYQWNPQLEGSWQEVADLAAQGLEEITRIAVSQSGTLIAIVAQPGGQER